jgi:SAM-dependent methyltransferase
MTDQQPGPHPIAPRETFNRIADQYDRMRPGYPAAVFDEIARIAALDPDASMPGPETRLLEVGCGTGHATIEFARRGLAIDCIELGENMAEIARARLASFPRVTITVTDFDRFTTSTRYRLIYAATAYHWLNPQTRVPNLAALLEPAGWLAVWRNHHVHTAGASSDFHAAAQQVYAREAPALAAKFCGLLAPDRIPQPEKDEWLASGLFTTIQAHTYLWSRDYTAEQYVQMLNTHSDHQLLPEPTRARLFAQLAELVNDHGDAVTREYATLLHMAQKRS